MRVLEDTRDSCFDCKGMMGFAIYFFESLNFFLSQLEFAIGNASWFYHHNTNSFQPTNVHVSSPRHLYLVIATNFCNSQTRPCRLSTYISETFHYLKSTSRNIATLMLDWNNLQSTHQFGQYLGS